MLDDPILGLKKTKTKQLQTLQSVNNVHYKYKLYSSSGTLSRLLKVALNTINQTRLESLHYLPPICHMFLFSFK